MANNISWNESSPANTDDVLEGALRIREDKEATRERLNRDHMVGGVADPSAESGITEGNDSGFHRRITLQERGSYNPASRLTTINNGATTKFGEVYLEGTTNEQRLKFTTSDNTERETVTLDQTQTLTNKTLTSPTINTATIDADAGSIDNVTVGSTTPTTARVTKIGVNKALPSGDGDADIGGDLTVDGNTTIGSASSDTLTINATVSGNQNKSGLVGEIKMWPTGTAPTGWLLCTGQTITNSESAAIYADLVEVLNSGQSSATVPDFRGRTPVGAGTQGNFTSALGVAGGDDEYNLSDSQVPLRNHSHTIPPLDFSHGHTIKGAVTSNVGPGGAAQSPWVHLSDAAGPD
jgi:microcystin-dependent protein